MSEADPSVKRRGPQTRTNHTELKRRRVLANLTLDELAERADSSKSHLSQIETGKYNASRPLTGRLAEVLGCDITDLMASNGNADTP